MAGDPTAETRTATHTMRRFLPRSGVASTSKPVEPAPPCAGPGHVGHARLANRMIYWLRRSSPIWLAQASAIISRPDEISGLALPLEAGGNMPSRDFAVDLWVDLCVRRPPRLPAARVKV